MWPPVFGGRATGRRMHISSWPKREREPEREQAEERTNLQRTFSLLSRNFCLGREKNGALSIFFYPGETDAVRV